MFSFPSDETETSASSDPGEPSQSTLVDSASVSDGIYFLGYIYLITNSLEESDSDYKSAKSVILDDTAAEKPSSEEAEGEQQAETTPPVKVFCQEKAILTSPLNASELRSEPWKTIETYKYAFPTLMDS